MVIVLLRSRRGRGFALLFSARWLGLATFSATRGSVGRLQVGSRPPLSGALIPRVLPAARRRSRLLDRLALLLPVRRFAGDSAGLARNSCLMKLALLLPVRRFIGGSAGLSRSCRLQRLALLLPVRRLVGDTARLTRSRPLQRLALLLPVRRLVGDTARLTRSCPLQRLALLLPVRRLVGDTAGLTRSWAANTALELASVFAAWGWHPFRRHSWPTGRRGRRDLLARFLDRHRSADDKFVSLDFG